MKSKALIFSSLVFVLIGSVAYYFQGYPTTKLTLASQISKNLEEEFLQLEADAELFFRAQPVCTHVIVGKFPFYIFSKGELTCWTDNSFLPPLALVTDTFSIQLLKTAKSNFLMYQKPMLNGDQFVSIVMLTREYPIQNSFLKNTWNENIFSNGNISLFESQSSIGTPVYLNSDVVFRIDYELDEFSKQTTINWLSIAFIGLGILLFFTFLYRYLKRNFTPRALLLFCCSILTVRILLLYIGYPGSVFPTSLFSSEFYAASFLNPSLGDLGLNVFVVFVLSLTIFLWYKENADTAESRNGKINHLITSILFSFLFFCTIHYPVATIQTITHNSSLQLAITESLDFSFLRIVAFLAIILSWCSAFFLSHIFLHYIFTNSKRQIYTVLIIGAGVFAAINWWEDQYFLHSLLVASVLILVVRAFRLTSSLDQFQYRTVSYLLVFLLGFALHAATSVYYLTKERQAKNQFRFAENFLVEGDSFAEFLLSEVSEKISRDVFIQTRLTSPLLSKEPIQQKIRQVHMPSYLSKYNVRVLLFNSIGKSVHEDDTSSFSQLLNSYTPKYERTEYSGLYKRINASNEMSQQYLLVVSLQRNQTLAGYVVVDLSIKRTPPQNTYPDLLVDNRFQESLRPSNLSYATFSNESILLQSGDFDYQRKFDTTLFSSVAIYKTGVAVKDFRHVAVRNSESSVTVVTGKLMSTTFFIANISFYFILGLFLILALLIGMGISNFLNKRPLYYSARIQLLVTLSFFVPLLIVSVVTLRLLSESTLEQLNNTYKNKSLLLSDQLSDISKIDSTSNFDKKFLELSRLSNLECSLYDSTGHLMITSQPLLLENQLIAPILSPSAFRKFKQGQTSFSAPERIGNLLYFVSYTKLRSSNMLLAVPYYQSASVLDGIQTKVLADILALFGVVFLVLLLFSYTLANWLIQPLKFVTQSLQQTSLNTTNKLLEWRANDEIGILVNSYNSMLQKLDNSKAELLKAQRESAWREIAQQVAHEIKNPLTPMKLSLQRLERGLSENSQSPEQMKLSIASMLEQVDVLNSIASSFSTFATLPVPKLQHVDALEILKKSIDFYNHGSIELKSNYESVYVSADPVLLQGAFSNIIINSLQAARKDILLQVQIVIELQDNRWLFTFSDNGVGIDLNETKKIFLPHFTTKSTGSGLGLAITKQSIERMHGSISFSSKVNEGTTFVIALPAI